jgi:hypothetical protein
MLETRNNLLTGRKSKAIVAASAAHQLATGVRQAAEPDMRGWLRISPKSRDVDKGAVIDATHKPGEMAKAVMESDL